jgi:hypothetical protein
LLQWSVWLWWVSHKWYRAGGRTRSSAE